MVEPFEDTVVEADTAISIVTRGVVIGFLLGLSFPSLAWGFVLQSGDPSPLRVLSSGCCMAVAMTLAWYVGSRLQAVERLQRPVRALLSGLVFALVLQAGFWLDCCVWIAFNDYGTGPYDRVRDFLALCAEHSEVLILEGNVTFLCASTPFILMGHASVLPERWMRNAFIIGGTFLAVCVLPGGFRLHQWLADPHMMHIDDLTKLTATAWAIALPILLVLSDLLAAAVMRFLGRAHGEVPPSEAEPPAAPT